MHIVLYYAPTGSSLPPYVTLTEANAEFEVQAIDFRRRQQHSAEYLKLNPKHKVPLLVVNGQPLSENVAIQIWIARHFPQAGILPSDSWQELKAVSMLSWCASGIHPILSRLNRPASMCDLPGSEANMRKLAIDPLFENFKIADDLLAGHDYFFDHFTAPDAHFFWCFRRGLQLNLDLSGFKNCSTHFQRVMNRPSVQKVLAYEKSVLAEFAKAA
jgi:glutathione S-transferase